MIPAPFPRWQRVLALAVPLLVSAGSAALVARTMRARNAASIEVRRSLERMAHLDAVRLRMVDAETGQRGFIITGDDRYLEPYHGAERDVWHSLGVLRAAARGGPGAARLDTISRLVEERLAVLNERIAIRRTQGFDAARNSVAFGRGRELMQRIRTVVDSVQGTERRWLVAREADEARLARGVFWAVALGGLLVSATVLLTGIIFQRDARLNRAAAAELEDANERLQEQAVELEAQSDELQSQAAQLEETVVELQATQDELMAQQVQLEGLTTDLEGANLELRQTNERLVEQTARAEEANRAKADFLATMSHELRTPLNAVGGYADLIDMGVHGEVTPAQREALSRIRRNQRYLLGLIEDILNFARVEAGSIEIRLAPVPVAEVLAGMEAVVAPVMAARELEYECVPGDAGLVARGDRERIEQILLNLLGNAAKFTGPGGRVRLWAERDGDQARIRVSDTGRGIPHAQLQNVFEPFVQLQRTPEQGSAQGVGLGLAISRELARAMAGDLDAESEAGAGSTFTLTLPAVGPDHPAVPAAAIHG